MAGVKTIKIDADKLRAEMRKRGLNALNVSKELGYSHGYINYVLKSGQLGVPAANQMKMRYNIDIDSIKPDEPKTVEPATPEPAKATPEEVNDLRKEVALLTATVKELSEEFRNYRVAMLGYMKKFENHKKYGHF